MISLVGNNVIQHVVEACTTWGGFVLTDHNIDPSLQQQVLALGHQFFQLNNQTKEKYQPAKVWRQVARLHARRRREIRWWHDN